MSGHQTADRATADDSSLMEMIGAVRKHFWLALAVVVLTVFAAGSYGLSRTKIYRAQATLQIDPRPPTPLGQNVEGVVELGTRNYWATLEYYNTQHKLIASLPVALAAVRELGLQHDLAFLQNRVTAGEPPEKKPTEEQAAHALMSRLSVNPVKESRLVEVTLDDADKERAARVLGAVLRAYVAHNIDKMMDSTSSAVQWLGVQLESLREELGDSELALHNYKLEKQIASLGIDDQTTMLKQQMAQLSTARTEVQAKIQAAGARVAQLKGLDPTEPQEIPQMELLGSEEFKRMRTDYLANIRERQALIGAGKGDKHPLVMAATARVEAGKAALKDEIENIQKGAERELSALRQQAGGLGALLKQAEQEALELNLMEIEYSRLKRTKDNNEKLYSLVLERSKETGLTQMLKVNNIQTIAPPATGPAPVAPRLTLILGAGTLFGLALGFAAAFGRERMDRSIKSADELEKGLGILPLGAIPTMREQRGGESKRSGRRRRTADQRNGWLDRYVAEHTTSGFAEAVRAIRTNLMFMSPDQPMKRLLITSPNPSEGKTTVASNLSIAMAQAGQRVIFVDCDLRRPRLEKIFPSPHDGPRPSLSESLLDPTSLDGARLESTIENLSVLPAGPTPPNPTELLHSEAFTRLLDRLSKEYDLVLIDSPPLIVTDAAILSKSVDGTILVVRALRTHKKAAVGALRAIRDVGGNVVGAVLNAASSRSSYSGYGGYGYGYGYGYGQSPYGRSEAKQSSEQASS